VKNLLLAGLTLVSLVLASTSSATGESLEPIQSSGNLGSTILGSDTNTNSSPIQPSSDNTSTATNCPKPIPGESSVCSFNSSWGTTPAARKAAAEAAAAAND
jgi:hypothetical protein